MTRYVNLRLTINQAKRLLEYLREDVAEWGDEKPKGDDFYNFLAIRAIVWKLIDLCDT